MIWLGLYLGFAVGFYAGAANQIQDVMKKPPFHQFFVEFWAHCYGPYSFPTLLFY